jgi:hypothetical protein
MGISIGGIDIANSIINTEFRILVLEKIVDRLLQVAPPGVLSAMDMEKIRDEALTSIQKKYPEAGIKKL